MEISESLAFEIIGRKEVAIEIARRQIEELVKRVQRAEAAVAASRAPESEGPPDEIDPAVVRAAMESDPQ